MENLPGLTPQRYASCFEAFQAKTNEKKECLNWFAENSTAFLNNGARILSVGAGEGAFDESIAGVLKKKRLAVKNFCLLEPNQSFYEALRLKFKGFSNIKTIDIIASRIEEFKSNFNFDLLIFSHSFYYFENRAKVLLKAQELTEKNGKILVFHQTGDKLYEFQKQYRHRPAKDFDFNYSSDDLKELLNQLEITYQYFEIPCHLDVTEILAQDSLDVLSFLLEGETDCLPWDELNSIISRVRQISTEANFGWLLKYNIAAFLIDPERYRSGHRYPDIAWRNITQHSI